MSVVDLQASCCRFKIKNLHKILPGNTDTKFNVVNFLYMNEMMVLDVVNLKLNKITVHLQIKFLARF